MEIATHLRVIVGILCFTLVGIIIELIRQNRLKEHYAIIWLLTAVSIFIFGIWPDLLNVISRIVRLPFDYLIYGGLPLSLGHSVTLHPDNKPAI